MRKVLFVLGLLGSITFSGLCQAAASNADQANSYMEAVEEFLGTNQYNGRVKTDQVRATLDWTKGGTITGTYTLAGSHPEQTYYLEGKAKPNGDFVLTQYDSPKNSNHKKSSGTFHGSIYPSGLLCGDVDQGNLGTPSFAFTLDTTVGTHKIYEPWTTQNPKDEDERIRKVWESQQVSKENGLVHLKRTHGPPSEDNLIKIYKDLSKIGDCAVIQLVAYQPDASFGEEVSCSITSRGKHMLPLLHYALKHPIFGLSKSEIESWDNQLKEYIFWISLGRTIGFCWDDPGS